MNRQFQCYRAVIGLAVGAMFALAASLAPAQEKQISVWWEKGFSKAEDDALYEAVKRFEAKTGIKVDLSLYAGQDLIPKTVSALDAGTPPDVAFGNLFAPNVVGKWAYDGKLEDISGIIEPIKPRFSPNTVETALLYNDKAKKKAYYAFPLRQQTLHIEYWIDMLEAAGYKESDIPKDWKDYWSFWCDKAQPALRRKTGKRDYGIGMPMGVDSTDAFHSFLIFMDAYNVKLVDDDGKLTVDDPKVRRGLIGALTDYTTPYLKGCTPPSSTSWKDPDNNVAFHNKTTIMTHNSTISIATRWLDDAINEALPADQRAQAKKSYYELIRTAGFPNKPDGTPMRYRTAILVGVISVEARNKAGAKDFVSFLMQEENLTPYVEGELGRHYPVMKAAQERPFWTEDRHRKAMHDQYLSGTIAYEYTKNWKFTILNNENVWAKAMHRVVNEKMPVDKAVDELIARIKQVAG